MSERIPIVTTYRGVGLHADQSPARLEVVKAAIDEVHGISDPKRLFDYARDVARPPEARLLAAAKAEAVFEIAAEERRVRPDIDLDLLRASTAGLASLKWRHPTRYCSLLDVSPAPGTPGAAPRERPLRSDE